MRQALDDAAKNEKAAVMRATEDERSKLRAALDQAAKDKDEAVE